MTVESTENEDVATEFNLPNCIQIWVCPECEGWYGSSNAGNLAETTNTRSSLRNLAHEDPSHWGESTGTRSQCQTCKSRGKDVDRVLVEYFPLATITRIFHTQIESMKKDIGKTSNTILNKDTIIETMQDHIEQLHKLLK